jgi:hypothetical protein
MGTCGRRPLLNRARAGEVPADRWNSGSCTWRRKSAPGGTRLRVAKVCPRRIATRSAGRLPMRVSDIPSREGTCPRACAGDRLPLLARFQRSDVAPSVPDLLPLGVLVAFVASDGEPPEDSTALGAASTALRARLTALGARFTALGTEFTAPRDDSTAPPLPLVSSVPCASALDDSARTRAAVVAIVLTECIELALLGSSRSGANRSGRSWFRDARQGLPATHACAAGRGP